MKTTVFMEPCFFWTAQPYIPHQIRFVCLSLSLRRYFLSFLIYLFLLYIILLPLSTLLSLLFSSMSPFFLLTLSYTFYRPYPVPSLSYSFFIFFSTVSVPRFLLSVLNLAGLRFVSLTPPFILTLSYISAFSLHSFLVSASSSGLFSPPFSVSWSSQLRSVLLRDTDATETLSLGCSFIVCLKYTDWWLQCSRIKNFGGNTEICNYRWKTTSAVYSDFNLQLLF